MLVLVLILSFVRMCTDGNDYSFDIYGVDYAPEEASEPTPPPGEVDEIEVDFEVDTSKGAPDTDPDSAKSPKEALEEVVKKLNEASD